MEKKIKMKNDCPFFDDLSAWYDKEISDNFQAHVDECDECLETLKSFESYDRLITTNVAANSIQLEQIKNNCLEELSKEHTSDSPILPIPIWVKIAACAMLIGLIVVLNDQTDNLDSNQIVHAPVAAPVGGSDGQQSEITNDAIKEGDNLFHNVKDVDKPNVVKEEMTEVIAGRKMHKAEAPDLLTKQHNNMGKSQLALPSMQLVGFGYDGAKRSGSSRILNVKNDNVADYVHHVWLVKDPSVPLQTLKKILPNQRGVLDELISEYQDRYHLQFNIVDRNLQILVDHFDELGFQLLRPDNPQPGSDNAVKFADKFVKYDVDFVKE